MSQTSNDLLHSFLKIVRKPDLIMSVHGIMDRRRIREDGSHRGARGLLLFLESKGDGLTNSEIAESFSIKPASVSAMVKQLEQEDFVYRLTDENDKRISRIYLSDNGKKALKKLHSNVDKATEVLFSSLSREEQDQLLILLNKLEVSLEDDTEGLIKCHRGIIGEFD